MGACLTQTTPYDGFFVLFFMEVQIPLLYNQIGEYLGWDWQKILPDYITQQSAVYGIYIGNYIVYIGTTNQLRCRIQQHFRSRCNPELKKALLSNLFNFSICVYVDERDFKLERQLIKKYRPIYNKSLVQCR